MNHIEEILQEARQYIGTKEIPQNAGFKDPKFQAKMDAIGFKKGQSWCAYYVMLVLKEVYADAPEIWDYLHKYVSPGTQEMWANFRASKEIITGKVPKLGAVVIWSHLDGNSGHTGIVSWVGEHGLTFKSIEGNTSTNGSSNGDRVWENTHTLTPHGMVLKGFAYMPE